MQYLILTVFLNISFYAYSQSTSVISESEVRRIENILASDELKGRKVFTPGIEKAASFIIREFKEAGLKPFDGYTDFKQSFTMIGPESTEVNAVLDGVSIDKKNLIIHSSASALNISSDDHYRKIIIRTPGEFNSAIYLHQGSGENILFLVNTSLSKRFASLATLQVPQFRGKGNHIFILTTIDPQQYHIEIKQKIKDEELSNLIGILPGRTKPAEYVIFSAHYDHLGIGKADAAGDSVYNGANDDASGVTALVSLANYFHALGNNERTILFVAFTAEEIGEFGSAYFSTQIDPEKFVAMFNIEMIGTESKWGKNSAYITGYGKSDMGEIMQRNLKNSAFQFYPDPYPEQQLFLRSDNASLAKIGIPAHTISTSKMDTEKYYHSRGDEVGTLDLQNMTEIIRAIALSANSIISGRDTPGRLVPE